MPALLANPAEGDWPTKTDSLFGTWTAVPSNGLSYLVLTAKDFPERFTSALLKELTQIFEQQGVDVLQRCGSEAYTRVLSSEMREVANRYQDLKSLDKVYAVNQDVIEVQHMANAGIQQMLKNSAAADDLAAKTHNMESNAKVFHGDSRKLERMMYLRKLKINCILACVVVAVLLYIAVPFIIDATED